MGNIQAGSDKPSTEDNAEAIRAQANDQYQQRNKCYEQSRAAYSRGDHAAAKSLSQEAKRHEAQGKALNQQAAEAAFQANNAARGRSGGEVDLHGLRVAEAVARADEAIGQAKAEGRTSIVLIVGKGLHSADGVPKLRPAVMQLVDKHNLRCRPGVPNEGCILVEFVSAKDRGWFADWGCIMC